METKENMETKGKMECQMAKRFSRLENDWMTSVEQDADDSSDEEDVECSVKRYDFDTIKMEGNVLPLIASAVAQNLYWSRDVNQLYYQSKKKLLEGSEFSFTENDIEEWIEEVIEELTSNQFVIPGLPVFFKRYSKNLKNLFYIEGLHDNQAGQLIVDFFKKNPRLLLKMAHQGESTALSLDFYNLLENLAKIFREFNNIEDVPLYDYEYYEQERYENSLIISAKTLTHELGEEYRDEVAKRVEEYLRGMGIIIGIGGDFVNKAQRTFLINQKSETNIFFCRVLYTVYDVHGTTLPEKFIKDNMQDFLELYFEEVLLAEKQNKFLKDCPIPYIDLATRSNTHYQIQPGTDVDAFQQSFFGKLDARFTRALNQKKKSYNELGLYAEFARLVKSKNEKYFKKYYLDRKVLPSNFEFIVQGPLDSLVFNRLLNRSQTRLIRQKKEDAKRIETGGKPQEETVLRSLQFPDIKATGLEMQTVTCNGVRTDKVVNLESYENIYLDISRLIKLVKIDDKTLALWLRKALCNEPNSELAQLPKPLFKEMSHFLANFCYLMFVTETARHPSCWIIHQILLDQIINGVTNWKQALTKTIDNQNRPLMPMAAEQAVQGGRYCTEYYAPVMVRSYHYPGDKNKVMGDSIYSAEVLLMTEWFSRCIGKKSETLKFDDITKIICKQVERWYGVKIDPCFKNKVPISFEQSRDLLIAYRQKVMQVKLENILEELWGRTAINNRNRIIAEYCY